MIKSTQPEPSLEKEINEILARLDEVYENYSSASASQTVFEEIVNCEQELKDCVAQQKALAKRFSITRAARKRRKEELQKLEIRKNELLSRRSSAYARQAAPEREVASNRIAARARIVADAQAELSYLLEEAKRLDYPLSKFIELSPFYTILDMQSSLEEMADALCKIKLSRPTHPIPDLPPFDFEEELFRQLENSTDILIDKEESSERLKALQERLEALEKNKDR